MAKKSGKNKASKSSDKNSPQRGTGASYPLYARIIVCLPVLGWLFLTAFLSTGVYSAFTLVKQATDPEYIRSSVKKIAEFSDPLPAGFKYQFAAALFNANMVTLIHEPDSSGFMLGVLPAVENRTESAREMADHLADKGIPNISEELKVDNKGSLAVAGEKLEYVLGRAIDREGRAVGALIGCAILKDKRAFLIYAVTPAEAKKSSPVMPTLNSDSPFKSGQNVQESPEPKNDLVDQQSSAETEDPKSEESNEQSSKEPVSEVKRQPYSLELSRKLLSAIKRF